MVESTGRAPQARPVQRGRERISRDFFEKKKAMAVA